MRTRHPRLLMLATTLYAVTAGTSSAAAQTPSSKWEFEFHGGGMAPGNPTAGGATLPGPGAPFTLSAQFPPPAPQVVITTNSRRESSWYFGDGALLFNQAAAAVSANPVAGTVPFSARIVPLDPVLGRSLGQWRRGGNAGVRISRALTPRFSAEISVDYGLDGLRIPVSNTEAIEATRASFIPAFNSLIAGNPNRVLRSLTSTAAIDSGRARQLHTTGTLLVMLRTRGAVTPYGTIGAGVISTIGRQPSATLSGNYQFLNPSGSPINESDTITVRDAGRRHAAAGIVGGGVKYRLSSRWGVRLDARVALNRNTARTVLDTAPNVVLGGTPAGRGMLNADPSIQFSNSTDVVTVAGVTAAATSSLNGPALTGFRTLSGTGLSSHATFNAGIFWAF